MGIFFLAPASHRAMAGATSSLNFCLRCQAILDFLPFHPFHPIESNENQTESNGIELCQIESN